MVFRSDNKTDSNNKKHTSCTRTYLCNTYCCMLIICGGNLLMVFDVFNILSILDIKWFIEW